MSSPEQPSELLFQPLFGEETQPSSHNISTTNGSIPNISTTTSSIPFGPELITEPPCQWLMYAEITGTRIRIWDLIILIPNCLFLMFLIWTLKSAVNKLRSTNSPIFTAFYTLVFLAAIISVLRCLVAMTVNATVPVGDDTDKILWLVLRFFLLATELSVIVFGLAFGHLDSRTSIQRVLVVTFIVALLYSCTQGTLEFLQPDPKFNISKSFEENFDIFAHGGMIFWITSSACFFLVYSTIVILPWTSLRERLNLPSKKSFYFYSFFLALLNLTQSIGSALLYKGFLNGMCVIDLTTYLYFAGFHPLVYGTFLRGFFRHYETVIPFSYKTQTDEGGQEDDTVNLPYQIRNPKRVDYDNVSESGSFDSTHFVRSPAFKTGSINADVYIRGPPNGGSSLYHSS